MLYFYFDAAGTNKVSIGGTMGNPDITTGGGNVGYTSEAPLWVRNDSATKRYEDVTVTAVLDDAIVDKKYALDVAGSPGAYSDSINLPNIAKAGLAGDNVPIWRKVTVAAGTPSQNRVNIKHRVAATEFAA